MPFRSLSCPSLPSRRKRTLCLLFTLAMVTLPLMGCEKPAPPPVKNDAELKAITEQNMQRMMQEQNKQQPPR